MIPSSGCPPWPPDIRPIPPESTSASRSYTTPRDTIGKKGWREVKRFFGAWPLKKMEQLKRIYMVLAADGTVVTVAYRD